MLMNLVKIKNPVYKLMDPVNKIVRVLYICVGKYLVKYLLSKPLILLGQGQVVCHLVKHSEN